MVSRSQFILRDNRSFFIASFLIAYYQPSAAADHKLTGKKISKLLL